MIGLTLHQQEVVLSTLVLDIAKNDIPDSGPASHTSDICAFDRPNESKYGVPKF